MTDPEPVHPPDPFSSPTLLISVLVAARRSGDVVLERLAARRLAALGVKLVFAADLPAPAAGKGVAGE